MSTLPPDELIPDSFAATLYERLLPLARDDFDNQWSLLVYCNAVGKMFQLLDDWLRDSDEGPGWSLLLDVTRCPPEALPWLAQFVGVRIPAGLTDAQQRQRITSTDGFKRGTLDAMRGAALPTLTGAQHINFRERSGDPAITPEYAYYLDVSTYTSETPDSQATLNALLSQKPAAIVLRYSVNPGQTWQQVKDTGRTWQQVKDTYTSWDAVRNDKP